MKLRLLVTVILVGIAVVSLALEYELHFGGNAVVATQRANVFNSEFAAASERALNRPPITPITSIDLGEQVAVLWDTYGKDYWACYVRTLKGVRGWALCNSLRMGWEAPCSVAYWDDARTSELTACETSARTGRAVSAGRSSTPQVFAEHQTRRVKSAVLPRVFGACIARQSNNRLERSRGRIFGGPRRESMIEINQLRLSSRTRVAQPHS
jgi:hypothetical protein